MQNNMYTKSSSQNTQPRQNLAIELVVIVLCMAVVYSAVRFFLDRSNYSKGNEAYRRVDCSVAIGHFDSVINNWRIADIGGYAALSQQEKSECLDFKPALNQEQAGNASQAIVAYKNFINNHNTDTFLVKAARDRVKSLFEKNQPGQLATPELCDNLSQLQTNLIPQPDTNLPPLYFACAEKYTSLRDYNKATPMYESFLDQYPNHSLASQVKAAWAKSLVAQANDEGAGSLPAPELSGSTDGGPPVVTIQNDSPEPMRIVFSGPEGRIEELEECSSCQKYVGKGPESCPNQGPVGRYTLQPGEYDVVVKSTANKRVKPFKGSWTMNSGSTYSNCFYIITNPLEAEEGQSNPSP